MEAKLDAPRKQPLYFINGPIDFALVGGISIAAYFFVTLVYGRHDRSDPAIRLGQQLMWVCNWPHFAATSYRLYHSRDNIRQYPLTALVISLVSSLTLKREMCFLLMKSIVFQKL